jgi:hypothetical protein
MCIYTTIVTVMVAFGQVPGAPPDPDAARKADLLKMYKVDAAEFRITRDSAGRQPLELREAPVYNWQNLTRSGGQYGAVFVWTYGGCPEVVGSIFSNPEESGSGGRAVLHELHSLSSEVLHPRREASSAANAWTPRAALARKPVPDAPRPASSARSRMLQLRSIARDFSAHSISPYDDQRWELRLLPEPLFRYQSTRTDVIDGALFAFATSAGTDPEAMLLLEAVKNGDELQWQFALARFSDFNLFAEHKGKAIWKAERDNENVWDHSADHTYRLYRDRVIEVP